MKQPVVIDNKTNRVVDQFHGYLRNGSNVSVYSAYFSIYAFEALKQRLESVQKFRFLFSQPSFIRRRQELFREFFIEHLTPPGVGGNEFEIKLRNELKQTAIARQCAQWIEEKGEIRCLKENNVAQARMIVVENENTDDSVCIHGSVDFTTDGLGITSSSRTDINTALFGNQMVAQPLQMFNNIWNNLQQVEDVKELFLEQLNSLYKENSPEYIYYVTLYNLFNNCLDDLNQEHVKQSQVGLKNTLIWKKLYKFQQDGVVGAIDKIERYNGCIIADSVGLGKTFTALAIIKYYELRNCRVLVLTPKKIRDNWAIYRLPNDMRNPFGDDRFNYDILNHTDLSRYSGMSGEINLAMIKWSNYDLVVIDESHNFRNNNKFKKRETRYERLMKDVIKSGIKTHILMLSATPVNNRMADIKNQIAFITEGNNEALAHVGIPQIERVLTNAQKVFNNWSRLPEQQRTTDSFVEMVNVDYFKLLDMLTIARSRKHIERYYNMTEIGQFPERLKPINNYSEIDTDNQFPSIEKINTEIKRLNLGIYTPIHYIRADKRVEYEQKYDISVGDSGAVFRQKDRENNLVSLMRVGLLKRMESSINSFALTIQKILNKIESTLATLDKKSKTSEDYNSQIDWNEMDMDDSDFDDETIGGNVQVKFSDMDLIRWRQDLEYDKNNLRRILTAAQEITPSRDAKLQELERIIDFKIAHPINGNNKKVIVFTAYKDTAVYLYNNLKTYFKQKGIFSAVVRSGKAEANIPYSAEQQRRMPLHDPSTVLTLFSPVSHEAHKYMPNLKNEIDLLIATDCVSEGQNLQDCDYLINYDIHWNPVRIIQRFGRIDRIGSKNEQIQLVNFWPVESLDKYINLVQKVKGKMVLLDVSATGESNIIEDADKREMKELEYRRKQLLQLQEKVVNLEDIVGGISITDLTFSDFKIELMEYMKTHKKELEESPTGLYAIAHIDKQLSDTLVPGIIFALRQIQGIEQTKEQNALFPYYMIYITDSGEVRYSFMHAKKLLDCFKKICSGNREICQELVKEFNIQTQNGMAMKPYSVLLEKAIFHLIGKKREVGVESLFSRGGTTLQSEYFDGMEDFELVSFLILK